jgi:hypothetical protein
LKIILWSEEWTTIFLLLRHLQPAEAYK